MEFTLQTITPPTPYVTNPPISNAYLKNTKDMKIGAGVEQFSAGKDGIFLGAETFADAPFSVDMSGNLTANTGTFGGKLSAATGTFSGDISAATGTFQNAIYVGDSKVILDGTDGSLKIKDTSGKVIIYLGL